MGGRKYPKEVVGLIAANMNAPASELIDMIEESFQVRPPNSYIHSQKYQIRLKLEKGYRPKQGNGKKVVARPRKTLVAKPCVDETDYALIEKIDLVRMAISLVDKVGESRAHDLVEFAAKLD